MGTMPSAIIIGSPEPVRLFTAEGDRIRPIRIIMGPVTTGGNNLITLRVPIILKSKAKTAYTSP